MQWTDNFISDHANCTIERSFIVIIARYVCFCVCNVCASFTYWIQLVEMLSLWISLCVIIITAFHESQSAKLPFLRPVQIGSEDVYKRAPGELVRVREGAPPPLCAGRCASPTGPVCAFDAAGTARTFATLCELEAVSCHESTYYAITGLGEC